jgi:predicted RNase H-like HicB family nuclease
MAATYRIGLERDDDRWWVASVPAVPGAHTQGRSIAQALNRIREVLGLWIDEAGDVRLEPVIRLPAAARSSVRRALNARDRAAQAERQAGEALRLSIHELTNREKLSTRDVATLLQLSPSRVDQLRRGVSKPDTASPRARRSS